MSIGIGRGCHGSNDSHGSDPCESVASVSSVFYHCRTKPITASRERPLAADSRRLLSSRQQTEKRAMLKDKKIAVLGAGKLGEILIKGLLEAGVINIANIRITAGHQQRLDQMRERFTVAGTLSNKVAAAA